MYNKFEFNIIGNERQEAKATGDNFIQKWKKSVSFTIGSVLGTKDGGVIVVSSDNTQCIKYDNSGNKSWEKSGTMVIPIDDGGAISLESNGTIYYVSKYNSEGNQILYKRLKDCTYYNYMVATSDGGLIISYTVNSNMLIDKISSEGNVEWNQEIASDSQVMNTNRLIAATKDGGFLIESANRFTKYNNIGTAEWNVEAKGNFITVTEDNGFITSDAGYLYKYNNGNEKLFEVTSLQITAGRKTDDNGFILASGSYGNISKYNSENKQEWSKNLQLSQQVDAVSATSDGGFVIGTSSSIIKYNIIPQYTITLNNQSATSSGTSAIYERYGTGIYLDSAESKAMTTSSNPISKPSRVYTINYNANEGTCSTSSNIATYTFGGYYTSTGGSGTQRITSSGYLASGFANTTYSANATLYAKWTSASVTLPTPTRTGYTFNGWYTSQTGGTKVGNAGATYTPTSNTTLYAQWTANQYTISLDNQGAKTTGTTEIYQRYDTGVYLDKAETKEMTTSSNPIERPSKEYIFSYNANGGTCSKSYDTLPSAFNGYYQGANGQGVQIIDSDGYINSNSINTSNTNITVYADWIKVITMVTLPTPTRTGYTFDGWYTEPSGGNLLHTQMGNLYELNLTEDKTVYAHWTVNQYPYTVRYLEEGTNKVLATEKTGANTNFGTQVTENAVDIDGYNKTSQSSQSITIGTEGNVINFYYTKRSDLKYTVNYLEEKTDKVLHSAKKEQNQIFGTEINLEDVKEEINGYAFSSADKDLLTIGTNEEENVINIYYTKLTGLTYKVNYLEKDTNKEIYPTRTQGNQTFENKVSSSDEVISITGYKFVEADNEEITIGTANNVINLYYVVDEEQTKEISYSVEYYKDGEKQELDTQIEKATVQVLENSIAVEKDKINLSNKYVAYKLEGIKQKEIVVEDGTEIEKVKGIEEIPNKVNAGTTIQVYYVRNEEKTGYTLEYYYDNILDTERTVLIEIDKNSEVTIEDIQEKITANIKDDYEFLTTLNTPLEVRDTIEENIIKVHYRNLKQSVIDPSIKTAYKIEYYYDNVLDTSKSEVIDNVIGNKLDGMTLDTKAESNKKDGYKLLGIANRDIVLGNNVNTNVIKIYYVKDKSNPENPSILEKVGYKIEYYYNNILDRTKSEVIEATEKDKITKEMIADKIENNKLEGYKLVTATNIPLTISKDVNNNVIKVYYKEVSGSGEEPDENITSYKIEYYYDNILDTTKTEIIDAKIGEEVNQEEIKQKAELNETEEYKVVTILNERLVISENVDENVIKIYYEKPSNPEENPEEKDKIYYKIEYYYSGKLDSVKTEIVKAKIGERIERVTIAEKIGANMSEGYICATVLNIPLTLSDDINNNIVKVCYEKEEGTEEEPNNKSLYKIEYYYNGEIKNAKTEVVNAKIGDVIAKEAIQGKIDKNKPEEMKETIALNIPLIVSEDIENNVIKVHYEDIKKSEENPDEEDPEEKNKTYYKIEYYYDNKIDTRKTEVVKAEKGEVITKESIQEKAENNRVNTNETEKEYKLVTILNTPMKLTEDVYNNVIKVHYRSEKEVDPDDPEQPTDPENPYSPEYNTVFKVEYYYDDVIDRDRTEIVGGKVGEVIGEEVINKKIETNKIEGYKLLIVLNRNLKASENTDKNIIKVYYVKEGSGVIDPDNPDNPDIPETSKTAYKIEYYYDWKMDESKTQVVQTVIGEKIEQEAIHENIEFNRGEHYKLLTTTNVPLVANKEIENNIIKIYYVNDGTIDPDNPDKPIDPDEPVDPDKKPINPEDPEETRTVYKVEYYYDNNLDTGKSEIIQTTIGEVITLETLEEKINNNNKDGYKILTVSNTPLEVSKDIENNVVKVHYEKEGEDKPNPDNPDLKLDSNYKIEYYYNGVRNNNLTEIHEASKGEEITENRIKENIEKNKTEDLISVSLLNVPLMVSEDLSNNVIKVYYVVKPKEEDRTEYRIKYYYDNSHTATNVIGAIKGEIITNETIAQDVENNMLEGYELQEILDTPLIVERDPEENIINVYYVRKPAEIIVKYIDKVTWEEISEEEVIKAQIFDEYDLGEKQKEIEGYTLIETPEEMTGEITEERQVKTFYYAKTSEVVVKYLEKNLEDTNNANNESTEVKYSKELADEIVIKGYEGKEYSTEQKDIEGYTFVEVEGKTSGEMTRESIIVTYYYLQNTKVTVNYIDRVTGETIEKIEQEGKEGDKYTAIAKDFEGYVLVEKPEKETVTMTKEEIELNYYYEKVSEGVIEKHIDIKTNEVLESKVHEGNEGTEYSTSPKEFEGYDLVEDKLPENAEGEMTVEVIEVKYYYVRKASVKVEYIDKVTGEKIPEVVNLEETKDSTEYIYGHEGDSYSTQAKNFEGYNLLENEIPTNAEGTMEVSIKEDGSVNTETVVKYYYVHKSGGVIERHIDEITKEILESTEHEGTEGTEYSTSPKEFEGYDLVEDKLPENAKGTMTIEGIEVNYYYIRKASVKVEYIDKITNEKILEEVKEAVEDEIADESKEENSNIDNKTKDSTEYIYGHEGDSYKTEEKTFNGYDIVKEMYPENAEGTMEVIMNEDGSVNVETVVKYYYVHKSEGVIEKHIDVITGEVLERETKHEGHEGDEYSIKEKEFPRYDLVEDRVPENREGRMTKEKIEVNYYYIRKVQVRVEYLEEGTERKIQEDVVMDKHEGDRYYAESKNINGYSLVEEKMPENKEGTLGKDDVVVRYYYKAVEVYNPNDPNGNNNNNGNNNGNNYGNGNSGNNNSGNNGYNTNNKGSANSNINNNNGKGNSNINSNGNSNKNSINGNNTANNTNNSSTSNSKTSPYTGDMLPIIIDGVILLVIALNSIVTLIRKKQNKSKFIK